jgi:hypothetical protein
MIGELTPEPVEAMPVLAMGTHVPLTNEDVEGGGQPAEFFEQASMFIPKDSVAPRPARHPALGEILQRLAERMVAVQSGLLMRVRHRQYRKWRLAVVSCSQPSG